MITCLTYENAYEEPISAQEANELDEYMKVYHHATGIKKKEEYEGEKMISVIYYQENETVPEILALYPSLEQEVIIRNVEHIMGYRKEIDDDYLDGKCLCRGIEVFNETGMIYSDSRRYVDNQFVLEDVLKFVPSTSGLKYGHEFEFNYDKKGILSIMYSDDKQDEYSGNEIMSYFGYRRWAQMTYYHDAHTIIPNTTDFLP